jgi:hypothetical protein
MVIHHLLGNAGDEGRLAQTASLVLGPKPIPAPRAVRCDGLLGVRHQPSHFLSMRVHTRAGREIFGGLLAPVQHDDEWYRFSVVPARNVEPISKRSGWVTIGAAEESPTGTRFGLGNRRRGFAAHDRRHTLEPSSHPIGKVPRSALGGDFGQADAE